MKLVLLSVLIGLGFLWANDPIDRACRNLIVMYDECAKSGLQGINCDTAYGIVYGAFYNQFKDAKVAHNLASVCKMVCERPENYFANRVDMTIYSNCMKMFGH